MQQMGGQADLFFWLTVEGYRVTAQQQLEVMQSWQRDGKSGQTKGLLKAAALGVYEQYLSEKVSPVVPLSLHHACALIILSALHRRNNCSSHHKAYMHLFIF